MDDDDFVAIRRKSGFLPESLPEEEGEGEREQGRAEEGGEEDEGAELGMYRAVGELLTELRASLGEPGSVGAQTGADDGD